MESRIKNSDFVLLTVAIGAWDSDKSQITAGLLTENIKQSVKRRLSHIRDILQKECARIIASQQELAAKIKPESTKEERSAINAEIAELMDDHTVVSILNPVSFDLLFDFQSDSAYPYELIGKYICDDYVPLTTK